MASDGLVKTYDTSKVTITFGGVPIGGFTDGSFIKVTPAADLFVQKVGADGEIVRSRSNDNTHTVDITLMQSSPSNTYLTTVKEMDRLANMGIRDLRIIDLSGSSLFFWPQAYITKDPDVEYAKEATDRAWSFKTGHVANHNVNGDFIVG
jgi:hypothetical protein